MMKRLRFIFICLATVAIALSGAAGADDGAITNKEMSRTIKVPAFDQDIVNEMLPEAEHAFTDMMELYVPAQKASGELLSDTVDGGIVYCDIDGQPEKDDELNADEDKVCPDNSIVETLTVAKPLVNVFLYGPQLEVPHTAFAHRWFDTYAAVSLDDGLTWKQTNLSDSAVESSFNIEDDHKPSKEDPLPSDHNISLGDAFHAKGYETPYTAHCSECHGQGLQGVAQVPSCYSCHDQKWDEPTPAEIGPIVYFAEYQSEDKKNTKLKIEGTNAPQDTEVTILNAITEEVVGTTEALPTGIYSLDIKYKGSELPPCVVVAEYTDHSGELLIGPTLAVIDKKTGEPIENCMGTPVNLNDYPGGSYNVFQATVGNKTLVAWPSRYCDQGQPAYTLTTAQDDEDAVNDGRTAPEKAAQLEAITDLIRDGITDLSDIDLGLDPLPGFTSTVDENGDPNDAVDDLYLVDAFGVKGSQGSVDFAEEGYPQAGIVPYGCVWTARGVLLPGDDPRTGTDAEPVVESSHMVWTKAERLTSGRRDVNRIEVHGVKGAGFVITWQEDPEGLRPGQGLGPGEGWSGAVAHSQTDAWYSFINEEYFDIVEDPTVIDVEGDYVIPPIRIQDASLDKDSDEGGSGRPKIYVPMAVPMRLSNNAKCKEFDPDPDTGTPPVYCVYEATDGFPIAASQFGLKDQCADTVEIRTGPDKDPEDGTPDNITAICVADTNGDDVADLPNRANTSLTRPRTSLQSYDVSATDKSAWVIMAAEESKGLGKYFFMPDGVTDADADGIAIPGDGENPIAGYAEPCEEYDNLICTEEIGKNQWYFSFDMGTPDTSAGKLEPNSLVNNLVSQGNMLNQGEVYWQTGEMFGLMSTADMEDYSEVTDEVITKDYNFDILNTEIARRSSLLAQGVGSAMNNTSGLAAISSWKQGNMRQGGPADTMLRRFVLPDGYGCSITVNPEGPFLTSASINSNDRLWVEGSGLDGDETTRVRIRDAVTGTLLGGNYPRDLEPDFAFPLTIFGEDLILQDEEVPCAIQAEDARSGNWGPIFQVTNAPENCSEALPQVCTGLTAGIDINPYAFENMACKIWDLVVSGDPDVTYNPYYPKGLCLDSPTNLSSVVPDTCIDDGEDGASIACPTVDFGDDPDTTGISPSSYGIGDTNPILQGYIKNEGVDNQLGNTMRVLTWHQCPSDYTVFDSDLTDAVDCTTDDDEEELSNLRDQSWYNPLDVSKGHRGFLDGDFVMFLYGWSPNWRLNAKGNDRYDLYVRRSFDGGLTWTTLPESFSSNVKDEDGAAVVYIGDGTVTCESYRPTETIPGKRVEPTACYEFAAGANEHARNVTQHRAMRLTTLDPRMAKAGGPRGVSIVEGCTAGLFAIDPIDPTGEVGEGIDTVFTCDDGFEPGTANENGGGDDSDLRDPSRYFMVFEVGDNTTVEEGEAEPLDLFYSRAESFGDDYVVWTETDTDDANPDYCYPNDPHEDEFVIGTVVVGSGFCNEFDNMNTGGDTHSSEANLVANPDASKLYGVWSQWVFADDEDYESEIAESAAMARRLWWIDNWFCATDGCDYTLPGTQKEVTE